jgi:hypothetical protein
MTPHGPSTSSTPPIPPARNPYEALAAPDTAQLPPLTGPNPYEELAASPGSEPGPGAGHFARGGAPEWDTSAPQGPGAGPAAPDDDSLLGLALRPEENEPYDEGPARGRRFVRRRRRSRFRRLVKAAIALSVLLAFVAVGDRWAVLYADNQAAKKVQSALKLHAQPEVHIGGFPFLTQLASGRLHHVDITIPDMSAGRVSVAQVKGSVNDVRIVGGAPSSIKGAVLGRMHGDVLLDFDDLDRELGTSQVDFTAGGRSTVLAAGRLPVAGKVVKVRARAHLRRTGDHGVGTTVDDMRLDVPGLFSYLPGKHGGLRLARPVAQRVQHDAAKAKALFRVGSIAGRFGLTPQRAAKVRESERELHKLTGAPFFVDKLMKVNMLDVLMRHPAVLQKFGVSPALLDGVRHLKVPELADKLSLSMRLPDVPGDVRLRGVSVTKDGIRARLTAVDVPFGDAKGGGKSAGKHSSEDSGKDGGKDGGKDSGKDNGKDGGTAGGGGAAGGRS